ncbi:DNA-binding protein [Undibacterium rugosum]|uniref:DNA-binding protein n=1 Tax=Undibacterium rugosum TaxID=2762291 RepID=UPI001B825905|nr:DNA-binding protein [Undibacterium rugosum]MBR7780230.1 DNA-binding protein [Undibacterium rugosum]
MARTGLYKSEVKKARDTLLAQGKHPSVDAVRIELGNTGSKTTIHKYLKELEEDGDFQGRKVTISDALHDLVERLSVQLEDETNHRLADFEKQQTEMVQVHTNTIATLESSLATVKAHLMQSHEAMAQEKQSHAQTHDWLQKETITRHTLEQQVADLKERLADNKAHRLSLEEKQQHARDALEHYRDSAKEQRDQDIRRHEQQVQQLQAELRQLQQGLVVKQNEVTRLNQEGARIVAYVSLTQKALNEEQDRRRQLSTELEALRLVAQKVPLLESQLMEKSKQADSLRTQFSEATSHIEELQNRLQHQQLELATADGKFAMQQSLVEELRTFLHQSTRVDTNRVG